MSKVIHLSNDAHNKAKEFCREHSLKMSDWVSNLIALAIGGQPLSLAGMVPQKGNVCALVQKKKLLEHVESSAQTADDGMPVYAAPPFWAQAEH